MYGIDADHAIWSLEAWGTTPIQSNQLKKWGPLQWNSTYGSYVDHSNPNLIYESFGATSIQANQNSEAFGSTPVHSILVELWKLWGQLQCNRIKRWKLWGSLQPIEARGLFFRSLWAWLQYKPIQSYIRKLGKHHQSSLIRLAKLWRLFQSNLLKLRKLWGPLQSNPV